MYLSLNEYKEDSLIQLTKQINTLYDVFLDKHDDIIAQFECIDDQQYPLVVNLNEPQFLDNQKHSGQVRSIIKKLIDFRVVALKYQYPTYIIEAGSGTGMLSQYLSLLNQDQNNLINVKQNLSQQYKELQLQLSRLTKIKTPRVVDERYQQTIGVSNQIFVLVERMQGMRKKQDKYIKTNGEPVIRVCKDLLEVDLNQKFFDNYQKLDTRIVGKHVCGAATDICLSYIAKYPQITAIGIALCCHSKSDGALFVARELAADYGIDAEFLNFLHRLTSWQFAFAGKDDVRQLLGFKARKILDTLRILWLRNCGWDADIKCYWRGTETQERWMLLARKLK